MRGGHRLAGTGRRSLLWLVPWLLAWPSHAGAPGVEAGFDAGAWRLADGRVVKLAGIELPASSDTAEAAAVAAAILATGPPALEPEPAPLDRHGRLRVQLRGADGSWLQGELVQRGLALVAPAADVPGPVLAALLALEAAARAAGRGLWAGGRSGPWPAERVAAERGSYVLVRGRVQAVARTQEFVYLNFGDDWRRDFTVRVEARRVRGLARAGLDLNQLEGRALMVRGVLFEVNGPMIEVTHAAQIELLP